MDFVRIASVKLRRAVVLILTIMMIMTSLPLNVFAGSDFNYDKIPDEKAKFLNKQPAKNPADFGKDPTTKEEANAQIKNSTMPKLYNIKAEYKANKDDELVHLYNPYEATVGDEYYTYKDYEGNAHNVLTEADKKKIKKIVDLPKIDGYTSPTKSTDINYDYVKKYAQDIGKMKPGTYKWIGVKPYIYEPIESTVRVKHIFQDLYDKNKYGLKDGETEIRYTTETGLVGSEITVHPLDERDRKGYIPEKTVIKTRVPDNRDDIIIEYRYNRKSFAIKYDMQGGSDIPSQKLYYGQTIPNLNVKPKKVGGIFVGWKSDTDLNYKDANGNIKTIHKDTKFDMKDFKDGIKEAMPARDIKFTAIWKDESKANYTIQFWTEKADSVGYDYIGAKVVKDADTGTRPDLSLMMPSGIKFPEIDKSLTEDAKVKELNKYYVRNEDKITKENTEKVKQDDGTNLAMSKKVQPDGRTTYNIYYDRQRYTMLFEKFCIDDPNEGFPAKEAKMVLPDGTKYDSTKEVNKPYNFVAKFGERMKKWPNDMWLIEKGGIDFDPNRSFIGWQLNSENNKNEDQSLYLDTPPYWLTSKDFIDRDFTGYYPDVRPATHSTSTGELLPERTISLGPCSSAEDQFAIYYMEYIFEGVDGALHYNPDMSYTKIDTSGGYSYPAPGIVGFKPRYDAIDPVDDALNRPSNRKGNTEDLSELSFDELGNKLDESEKNRKNNEKSFFDPIAQNGINGVPFKDIPKYRFAFTYEREKYKIYLDTDSSDINEQSELAKKKLASGKDATVSDVYYDIPLRKLDLDEKYKLTEADRPANVPDDFVFKGWSMDPQGTKLIKDTIKPAKKLEGEIAGKYEELAKNSKDKEKKYKIQNEIKELKAKLADVDANMPNYNLVLYAKWGEPDKSYKVKFDPDGGTLKDLDPLDIAAFKDGEMIQTSAENTTYSLPKKLANEGDVQVFSVKSRMSIKNPPEPKRKGYDFLGWELVRYNKDGSVDTSFVDKYDVPELYAFGNEVVEDSYLKAIWVKNDLVDIPSIHIFLDENFKEDVDKRRNLTVSNRRVGEYAEAIAKYQGQTNLTIPKAEWEKLERKSSEYKEYVEKTGRHNTYSQELKVEPKTFKRAGKEVDNPKVDNNIFKFFYREFTKRHYKVNYLSTTEKDAEKLPAIGKMPDGSFKIIDTEEVTSGCTDYDSVNYREIPGWKIISTPQRQLFYDINADNEMEGINGEKSDEVNFYYQDVRVIKRKTSDAITPDGYHRVVFKADRDGSFGVDADGKKIKEVVYDVIDGLEFKNIQVPPEQNIGGTLKAPVITPDPNAQFVEWNESRLLDKNTVIRQDYTFTAKFKPINDVIKIETGKEKVQDYFVDVYVDTTDRADADVNDNQYTGDKKLHFKVNPEKQVVIPVKEPKGGVIKDKNGNPLTNMFGIKQRWQFKEWQVENNKDKVWTKGKKIEDKFTDKVTTIVAKYNLKATPIDPILTANTIPAFESSKDAQGGWINNFVPTKDKYDEALKDIMKKDGYKSYKIITSDEEIYNNLKEDGKPVADNQPRTFNIKAEVSFEDGRKTIVNIPVKVFKNIYRGLNDGEKPDVVKNNEELKDYVKVTVNPTDLAKDKTKKVYYVNPKAKVIIPEKDPSPIDKHTFKGWYYIDKTKITEDNPTGRVEVDLSDLQNIPKDTEIIASYETPATPIIPLKPEAKQIVKNIGDTLTVDDYEKAITPPKDKNGKDLRKIKAVKIVKPAGERVTTKESGNFKELIEVIYEDGATYKINVDVKVLPDYVEQTGNDKPDVPDNYVRVVFKPTDKAEDSKEVIFWVNPKKEVELPITEPKGKKEVIVDGRKTNYVFKEWHFEADDKVFDAKDKHQFKNETIFIAKYKKVIDAGIITPAPNIKSTGITVTESLKDGDKWINNFIPSEDDIRKGIKIENKDGKLEGIPDGAKVEFGDGNTDTWKKYDDLEKVLYEKLKEKDDGNNPSRKESIKAKVTIDGISKIIEIPINVNKNIYEAKTSGDKPNYVPDGYVKVELDPTKDGVDSQKKFYYVNPKALVKIPGKDPSPATDKVFTGWVLKEGNNDEKPYSLSDRYKFTENENVIKAVFVADVVEQKDKDKPNVPDYFVQVIVDYTNKAKLKDGEKSVRTFWVNPNKEVTILDKDPVPEENWTFEKWTKGDEKINMTGPNKFTEKVTKVTARYSYEMTPIEDLDPKIGEVETYVGKTPENDDYIKKLVPPKGKEIDKIKVITEPDVTKPGKTKTTVEITYKDGSGTTVDIPVIVKDNIYPADGNGNRTPDTPDNYVKVVVDPTEHAKDSKKKIYYVNPKVEIGLQIDDPEGLEHWNFLNWKVDNDTFDTKANHKFDKDTTIYAVWNKDPNLKVKDITITKGDDLDLKTLIVKADDQEDGNLIDKVEIVSTGGFDKDKLGKYEIVFRLTDKNGAVTEARAFVTVASKPAKPDGSTSANGGKNSPTTGDSTSNGFLYLGTLGIALLLAILGKRRKNDSNN